jgi:phosphatidylserine synthase
MIDLEKSEKLPKDRRYFNISIIWIFYFRSVIRLLYRLRIPHEVVTLLSITFGLLAAYLFYTGQYLWAALGLHLKDIFDASDGALARLTGRGHLIGRYLDSLGDFLALTAVMGAITLRMLQAGETIYLIIGPLAIVSTFIQCSYFNYYQLTYVETFGIKTLSSKRDETCRDDIEQAHRSRPGQITLQALRFFYRIIYAWQDRLIDGTERRMRDKTMRSREYYHGNKFLMTLQSVLCFGTHIFIMIAFAAIGHPEYALTFIAGAMNIYLLSLLYLRMRYYRSGEPILVRKTIEEGTSVKE